MTIDEAIAQLRSFNACYWDGFDSMVLKYGSPQEAWDAQTDWYFLDYVLSRTKRDKEFEADIAKDVLRVVRPLLEGLWVTEHADKFLAGLDMPPMINRTTGDNLGDAVVVLLAHGPNLTSSYWVTQHARVKGKQVISDLQFCDMIRKYYPIWPERA